MNASFEKNLKKYLVCSILIRLIFYQKYYVVLDCGGPQLVEAPGQVTTLPSLKSNNVYIL